MEHEAREQAEATRAEAADLSRAGDATDVTVEDLVEEVSIDGMCGVY